MNCECLCETFASSLKEAEKRCNKQADELSAALAINIEMAHKLEAAEIKVAALTDHIHSLISTALAIEEQMRNEEQVALACQLLKPPK